MAEQSHVELLRRSVPEWNQWRLSQPKVRPNLAQADLWGSRLSRANLANADLSAADLANAELSEANLRTAELVAARLSESNMRGATLWEARLGRAELVDVDLFDAVLFRAMLVDADLTRASLVQASLFEANLTGAKLVGADLRSAVLTGARLQRADLTDIRWDDGTKWPDGFEPPPAGYEPSPTSALDRKPGASDEPRGSPATKLKAPAIVDALDSAAEQRLVRGLEPLMGWVRNSLQDGRIDGDDEDRIDHVLSMLDREVYRNPGRRHPTAIAEYFADLIGLISPYLEPEVGVDGNDQVNVASAQSMVEHLSKISGNDPEQNAEHAARAAESLAETIEGHLDAEHPKAESDQSEARSDAALRRRHAIGRVVETLTWASIGVATGVDALPQLVTWFTPGWSAITGGAVCVLSNLFRDWIAP